MSVQVPEQASSGERYSNSEEQLLTVQINYRIVFTARKRGSYDALQLEAARRRLSSSSL